MNRRHFLLTSAAMFAGSLLGFQRIAHATADPAHPSGHKLALIIDDLGFSRQMAHRFLELDVPLTFSILPRLPLSSSIAEAIHACGHELMLHQPMEPIQSTIDPGPGAIYVHDNRDQIEAIIRDNIHSLAHISGINNHMGSRFTQHAAKMNKALGIVRDKGLYFVDSLTTRHSKAFSAARHLQIATMKRDVFIDPVADSEFILAQLLHLNRKALRFGTALGIGHPYPETLVALRRFFQGNHHHGVEMVYVSKIMCH